MVKGEASESPAGTQTLLRGLAVIDAVAKGARALPAIGAAIACTRSTTHRLVATLVHEGFLKQIAGVGYVLGSRLIALGYQARDQLPLAALARPALEALAEETQDTVHLGVVEGNEVFYVDKLPGNRGLEMRSRIGYRMPLAFTGVGKALMLDMSEDQWCQLYKAGLTWHALVGSGPATVPLLSDYLVRLRDYAAAGTSFDLEENEVGIRCVAAPIRDAGGAIVAAISVASAVPYMPLERMPTLRPAVIAAAATISKELGWQDLPAPALLEASR
jgi:DNA-binding IclR family transcriptional regulator